MIPRVAFTVGVISPQHEDSPPMQSKSISQGGLMSYTCSRALAWLSTLILCTTLVTVGLAQSDNAQISGYVKDTTGAVIPGVRVVAKNQSREFERSAVSNNEGYYVISNLPPGLYNVTAEQTGF